MPQQTKTTRIFILDHKKKSSFIARLSFAGSAILNRLCARKKNSNQQVLSVMDSVFGDILRLVIVFIALLVLYQSGRRSK